MKTIRHHFASYPVNTPALALRGYGVQERMSPGMIHRPSGIECYLLVYFYDEVSIRFGNAMRRYPARSVVLWEPGIPHEFGDTCQPWNHSWLLCGGTRFAEQVHEQRLPVQTVNPLANPALLERFLLDIEHERTSHAAPHADLIWNALHSCLIELGRALNPLPADPLIPEAYLAIKHYLETHYTEKVTLTDLAAQVHHSIPRLCRNFRAYFGHPPLTYVIVLRMHEAAYLLRNQNLTITEIAHHLGYADLYYFSRQFRQHYHLSPRQMRAQHYQTPAHQ